MSNLENLTQKIIKDAKTKADELVKDANRRKEEIINEQVQKAQLEKERIIEKGKQEAESIKTRTLSSAELEARNEILKAKQEVIDRVFQLAEEKLRNLNENEYVEFLKNKIHTLDLSEEAVLLVPDNRRDVVKSLELAVKVSDIERVDSGFVVIDKNIKINFSFDTLIDFLREDFESEIAQELFKGQE